MASAKEFDGVVENKEILNGNFVTFQPYSLRSRQLKPTNGSKETHFQLALAAGSLFGVQYVVPNLSISLSIDKTL